MILQSTNNQMITFGGKNKNDKTSRDNHHDKLQRHIDQRSEAGGLKPGCIRDNIAVIAVLIGIYDTTYIRGCNTTTHQPCRK